MRGCCNGGDTGPPMLAALFSFSFLPRTWKHDAGTIPLARVSGLCASYHSSSELLPLGPARGVPSPMTWKKSPASNDSSGGPLSERYDVMARMTFDGGVLPCWRAGGSVATGPCPPCCIPLLNTW